MDSPIKSPDGMKPTENGGISRSGRLRKKSSKLNDFDSSDDVDPHPTPKRKKSEKSSSSTKIKVENEMEGDLSDFDDIDIKEEDDWDLPDDDSSFLKLTEEDFQDDEALDGLNLPSQDLEFDVDDDFDVEDDEDNSKEGTPTMAQSLYFSEKQGGGGGATGKRSLSKDSAQSPRKKAQRKDKGKSRFTAYMLWAREARAELTAKHPDLDFSAVNKKLGELWQLVPTRQRYNWKRRAKRLAVRLRQGGMITTGGGLGAGKLVSGATGANGGLVHHVSPKISSPTAQVSGGGRRRGSPGKGGRAPGSSPVRGAAHHNNRSRGGGGGGDGGPDPPVHFTPPPGTFRVTGTAAIDVAAHMKLLGESLNNIGNKLREHEGQFAVSGSFSVLLDSMLCVLGPLMCLTDQMEEVKGAIPPATHHAILDNIAYIMPGIV